MAFTSVIMAAMPITTSASTQKSVPGCNTNTFNPLPVVSNPRLVGSSKTRKFQAKASMKEKAVTGLTAAALTASMMIPEVAEAAGSGITPSLNNFLLSIVAGGVVLGILAGAIIGVANFDPVKRS